MQFSMIYTSLKHILRKSIFRKKWFFCDFLTKFIFQKITVLVTKRHQKFKNFSESKNMDHKLSKDVFGMLIRFLVQVLWEFKNFLKYQKSLKMAILSDFWYFKKFLNSHKTWTKNRISIPNTSFESLWSIFFDSEKFLNFWCLFVTKTVIFWKINFVKKSQKNHFFRKIDFLKMCFNDV